MSKERLEEIEAKYSTLTVSSERDGTEYTEVDVEDLVFMIQNGFKQAERVQELEDFKRSAEQLYKNYHLSAKRSVAEKEELREQNERYQDMLVKIFKIVQNHQIMKISDEDYADAATILYKWIYDTGAIDHEKHFSELHGHDEFDSHQISLLLKKHIDKESSKALEESK